MNGSSYPIGRSEALGQTEIAKLDRPMPIHQQIVGLQISEEGKKDALLPKIFRTLITSRQYGALSPYALLQNSPEKKNFECDGFT